MDIWWACWLLFQVLIGYNLILPFVLFVFWRLRNRNQFTAEPGQSISDYAIIVTAYKQVDMIPAVVDSILKLRYENYVVYIVADNCDISALKFNDSRIIILRPENTLAANTKSHAYAINSFVRNHDRITIIDSDNLVDPDYLSELDTYFAKGFLAVQGVRLAKNLDTDVSRLDAARDIYYHFFDGQILFELGSSATLSGSGMAFRADLYKDFLKTYDVQGAGFDKVLQYYLVSNAIRIAYAEDAIVYDEKTSKPDQLVNQRSRWINTWFKYFSLGFSLLGRGVAKSNRNQLLFGLILLRPPLFIFIVLSLLCFFINLLLNPLASSVWFVAFLTFLASFFIALKKAHADERIYTSLRNIPTFIYLQLISLLKSPGANKRSVATTHYHDQIVNDVNRRQNEDRT